MTAPPRAQLPDFWRSRRDHAKDARRELAAEWHRRGVTKSDEYRQLTNALFEATFGMDVNAYRGLKGLPRAASLRDHMDDAEVALTSLAESMAVFLLQRRRARGFAAVLEATRDAGAIAGRTRFELERRVGHVSTPARRTA